MRSTKFVAPASDRLTAEQYSPSGHQFFHITEAHTEPEVEPNAVRNDLLPEPMATVRAVRHSSSMPFADKANVTIPVRLYPGRLARSTFSYSLRACANLCSRSRRARSPAFIRLGSDSSAASGSPIAATCSRAIFKCFSIRFLVQNELLPAFA